MVEEPPDPKRRATDQPIPAQQALRDRGMLVVFLSGSIGFLYEMSTILGHHTDWAYFRSPPGAGEVIFAMVCGLSAIAAALGLNVTRLLKGIRE